LNSATGTTYTLTKGMICRSGWKNGGKVDAAACAQLCKKQRGCTEFSVGGMSSGQSCRFARNRGGCCNKWSKRKRNGWNNAGWRANMCTPFRNRNSADCSWGGCKFYTKKIITTMATRWSQWGPAKRRCTKKRRYKQWKVHSQDGCQDAAVDAGHNFYQYYKKKQLCATWEICTKGKKTRQPWKIYANRGAKGSGKVSKKKIRKITTKATLWKQFGTRKRMCNRDQKHHRVSSREACQDEAIAYGHAFYSYKASRRRNRNKCFTSPSCNSPRRHRGNWKIYKS